MMKEVIQTVACQQQSCTNLAPELTVASLSQVVIADLPDTNYVPPEWPRRFPGRRMTISGKKLGVLCMNCSSVQRHPEEENGPREEMADYRNSSARIHCPTAQVPRNQSLQGDCSHSIVSRHFSLMSSCASPWLVQAFFSSTNTRKAIPLRGIGCRSGDPNHLERVSQPSCITGKVGSILTFHFSPELEVSRSSVSR